ncbi:MAG: hypothetical protein NVSMB62_17960 [Acidobacteriaceae bacterium]
MPQRGQKVPGPAVGDPQDWQTMAGLSFVVRSKIRRVWAAGSVFVPEQAKANHRVHRGQSESAQSALGRGGSLAEGHHWGGGQRLGLKHGFSG